MENTNDSNTDRCGKHTVKRNTILTQDYLSSTPLFLSPSPSHVAEVAQKRPTHARKRKC
jgi:hypothetical protein